MNRVQSPEMFKAGLDGPLSTLVLWEVPMAGRLELDGP